MIKEGTRVTTTPEYNFYFPKSAHRVGVVLGRPKYGTPSKQCWRIKWDKVATPVTLHEKYVEPVGS